MARTGGQWAILLSLGQRLRCRRPASHLIHIRPRRRTVGELFCPSEEVDAGCTHISNHRAVWKLLRIRGWFQVVFRPDPACVAPGRGSVGSQIFLWQHDYPVHCWYEWLGAGCSDNLQFLTFAYFGGGDRNEVGPNDLVISSQS